MADVDRCVICGDPIPEGAHICKMCEKYGGRSFPPSLKPPTVADVRRAARIIKEFCKSRDKDPETDCIECPIKDICLNEPYLWEV